MRLNYFNQITSLFLFVLCVTFVSCKKDSLSDPKKILSDEECCIDPETEMVAKRIMTFERQLDDIESGKLRHDSYIDIDSAMWNIEALFNSTFSSPDEDFVEKKIQELSFDIDIRRDNKLSMKDVSCLYDEIIDSVRNAYANDGFNQDKGLMSIVLDKGECDTRGARFKVTLITGRKTKVSYKRPLFNTDGPFDRNACWYYGEYGGSCDDPYLMTDAAELLEDTINYFLGSKYSSINNSKERAIYVDMTIVSLNGSEYSYNGNNPIFYKKNCNNDDLYLTGNELNYYYNSGQKLIFDYVPNNPKYASILPQNPTFIEVNIDGLSVMQDDDYIYYHNHNILYGRKYVVLKQMMSRRIDILTYQK